MNKTTSNVIQLSDRLTANTETLAECLDCGRSTAVKIGEAAGAKIQMGKRILWNVNKWFSGSYCSWAERRTDE